MVRGEAKLAWPRAIRALLRRRRAAAGPCSSLAVALVLVGSGIGAYFGARETGIFALDRIQITGAPPSTAARIRAALAQLRRRKPRPLRPDRRRAAASRRYRRSPTPGSTATSRTPSGSGCASSGRSPSSGAGRTPGWCRPRRACPNTSECGRIRDCRGSGCRPAPTSRSTRRSRRRGARRGRGGAAPPAPPGRPGAPGPRRRRPADAGARVGHGVRLGDSGDLRLKLSIAKQILPLAGGAAYVDVSVPERPVAGYKSQVGG